MKASMIIIRDILYASNARGGNLALMCKELGLQPEELHNSEEMVHFEVAAQVWDVALAYTNDPILGLHIGEEISPTITGMIGYLIQSSNSLYEAYCMFCKFNELFSTIMKFSINPKSDQYEISYEPIGLWEQKYSESARQSIEIAMSGVLRMFDLMSHVKILPTKVLLKYPSRNVDEYQRIFKCDVIFNSAINAIYFNQEDLSKTLSSKDEYLFNFFNQTLEEKLNKLKSKSSLAQEIKQIIIRDFKGKTPSIELIASKLYTTIRSVQRKLKEEGTSYRKIDAELKFEIAQSILQNQKFRMNELSDFLGYSDPSNFKRAFNRWNSVADVQ